MDGDPREVARLSGAPPAQPAEPMPGEVQERPAGLAFPALRCGLLALGISLLLLGLLVAWLVALPAIALGVSA